MRLRIVIWGIVNLLSLYLFVSSTKISSKNFSSVGLATSSKYRRGSALVTHRTEECLYINLIRYILNNAIYVNMQILYEILIQNTLYYTTFVYQIYMSHVKRKGTFVTSSHYVRTAGCLTSSRSRCRAKNVVAYLGTFQSSITRNSLILGRIEVNLVSMESERSILRFYNKIFVLFCK